MPSPFRSFLEHAASPGRALLRRSYRFGLPYVRSREELPYILNALNLTGEGAEIGVRTGGFSRRLLDRWAGTRLHLVDAWRVLDPATVGDVAAVTREHEANYAAMKQRIAPHASRTRIHRTTSVDAAAAFADAQLDFAYIDACHSYEAVCDDLAAWRPKVRPGGLLCGHDYLDGTFGREVFGVKTAVDEYARTQGLRLHITHEPEWPSWIIRV